MTNYIQRLMTATREELEAPVKSAIKEAIADAHAHDVSTVGTRNGQVVLVRPSGEAVDYPKRKARPEPSHTKIKAQATTGTYYVLPKRRQHNAIYRKVRDALEQRSDLAAVAEGKRAGAKPAKQVAGGVYYTCLHRDPVTGRLVTEEVAQKRYKQPRKGDALTMHSRQGVIAGGVLNLSEGRVFRVDTDDMGPSIITDDRYLGLLRTVGQGGVKVERAQRGYVAAFEPKSIKKKGASRKGRHTKRG
jgi:hypothetical protein